MKKILIIITIGIFLLPSCKSTELRNNLTLCKSDIIWYFCDDLSCSLFVRNDSILYGYPGSRGGDLSYYINPETGDSLSEAPKIPYFQKFEREYTGTYSHHDSIYSDSTFKYDVVHIVYNKKTRGQQYNKSVLQATRDIDKKCLKFTFNTSEFRSILRVVPYKDGKLLLEYVDYLSSKTCKGMIDFDSLFVKYKDLLDLQVE